MMCSHRGELDNNELNEVSLEGFKLVARKF